MRIAVLSSSYPCHVGDPSGHFVRAEVAELVRGGHDVTVFAPGIDRACESGARVVGLGGHDAFGWPGAAARLKAKPWRVVDVIRWMVAARERVALHPGDRVIAHWAVPCAWLVADAAASLEVVSHGADVRLLAALPRRVCAAIVCRILSRASAWRFVSAELLHKLLDNLDADLRRRVAAIARVGPAPVTWPSQEERAEIQKRGAERRAAWDGPLWVCAGRLIASKRVDGAIDEARKSGAGLVVVGDGPLRETLERHARRTRAHVHFTGLVSRDEALSWMAAADLVISASRAEGCSTVLREARWLGVPVRVVP